MSSRCSKAFFQAKGRLKDGREVTFHVHTWTDCCDPSDDEAIHFDISIDDGEQMVAFPQDDHASEGIEGLYLRLPAEVWRKLRDEHEDPCPF